MNRCIGIFLALCFNCLPLYAHAPGVIDLTPFAQVATQSDAPVFKTPELKIHSLPYEDHAIWVRLKLDPKDQNPGDFQLVITPPSIDFAEIYREEIPTPKIIPIKKFPPFNAGIRVISLPIHLTPDHPLVLRIKTQAARNLSFTLIPQADWDQAEHQRMLLHGLFFGIALAAFAFNLLLWLAVREKSYAYYITYLCLLFLLMGMLNGIIPQAHFLTAIAAWVAALATQFTRTFLQTAKSSTKQDLSLKVFSFLSFSVGLLDFYFSWKASAPPWLEYLGDFCILGGLLCMVWVGILRFRKGFLPARFFLGGWISLLLACLVYFSGSYGLLSVQSYSMYCLELCASVEMVFFSLAWIDRIREGLKENPILQSRNALINILCHDLSNPISVVLNVAEREQKPATRSWSIVQKAALQQKDLLEKVRTLQAIQSGKLVFTPKPTQLDRVVANLMETFTAKMEAKKIQFEAQIRCSEALADPILLEQSVLGNILSNAIKFSKMEGRIDLLAHDDHKHVCIIIKDNGIGIPTPILKQIFSHSHATTRNGTLGEKGTGFGMPLVRALVEGMQGTLTIESSTQGPESGTRIQIKLPRVDA